MAFRAMNFLIGTAIIGIFSWGLYGQESVLTAAESKAVIATAKTAAAKRIVKVPVPG